MLRKSYSTLLAIVFILLGITDVFAWGTGSYGSAKSNDPCLFTIQLRDDPLVRGKYITKMIAAVQRDNFDSRSADDMYSNIQKASFEENDEGFLNSLKDDKSDDMGDLAGIDDLSKMCLECHNGSTAQPVVVNVKNDPYNRRSSIDRKEFTHPIGMDYSQYASSSRDFKQINGNPNMIFVDGKVGCLTCHDPINPERSHLSMSDRQSGLCLTCHNK